MLLSLIAKLGIDIKDLNDLSLDELIKLSNDDNNSNSRILKDYLGWFIIDIEKKEKTIIHTKSGEKITFRYDFEIVGMLVLLEWKIQYMERLKELDDLIKNDILQHLLNEDEIKKRIKDIHNENDKYLKNVYKNIDSNSMLKKII